MQYHTKKKDDVYLRQAIWESYQKKCVYCGMFIQPRHMEVDHIFPVDEKNIKKINDPDLMAYIAELKKDNFEKNSIENYILACTDCNKKKSNYQFSASNFRFYHEYAARHVSDILKRIERIKHGINSYSVDKHKEFPPQKYKEEELICEAHITNSGYQCLFNYGLGNVRVDAFLPVNYEDEMSCLISFKEIYQSDIFLTYDEESIKKYFFTGYKMPFNSEERRWCTFYEDLISEPVYQINLPHVKLNVSIETLKQMAMICDRLFEEYTLQIANIESILGVDDFSKFGKKSWKLFAINKSIWDILYEFMENHQYDQTADNKYNIFHLTYSREMFYLHSNMNLNQQADIYACIEVRESGDYYDVLWLPGYTAREVDKMKNFDNIIKWTASYTYDWFVNECIPYALNEYFQRAKGKFQKIINRYKNNNIYTPEKLLENRLIISYRNI